MTTPVAAAYWKAKNVKADCQTSALLHGQQLEQPKHDKDLAQPRGSEQSGTQGARLGLRTKCFGACSGNMGHAWSMQTSSVHALHAFPRPTEGT